MRITVIDYDAGNIKSVEKAFCYLGQEVEVTRSPRRILQAQRVVLPGVGAFGDAMGKLSRYGLIEPIRECVERGIPFLGICLGLQLLFESSQESPGVPGLGLLPGEILRLPEEEGLKIPHIGWNSLSYPHAGQLFQGIPEQSYVYFVHSYYLKARQAEIVTASARYGAEIHASVEKGNLFACQFHPEKSSGVGLQILRNFISVT